jgi:hypothetical protein
MPGSHNELLPIPLVPERTEWIPAGPLTFGVEFRVLDDDIIRATYKEAAAAMLAQATGPVFDSGVSIHVLGTADQVEYLRFDCFDDEPHYHYIHNKDNFHERVDVDTIADGDILDWSLERIRTRLPVMLVQADAAELAGRVDGAAVEAALPAIIEAAGRAAKQAPAVVSSAKS